MVTLVQALVKGDRGELAVELATEAGVDAVLPWRAARCVARWEDGPRGEKALARWRSTALAAAKQSRRAWLPTVGEPVGTRELLARCSALRTAGGLALVLHESASVPLTTSLADAPDVTELLLVVGPEGGVSDEELDALTAAGAHPVRLGREVLRASTAAAVALGAIGALTTRW
jgi:16S rRNA (uracil1498-N3)-methyltransferase